MVVLRAYTPPAEEPDHSVAASLAAMADAKGTGKGSA
jgi:isoamylase